MPSALLTSVSTSSECFKRLAALLLDCVTLMQKSTLQGLEEAACLLDTLGGRLLLSQTDVSSCQTINNSQHSIAAVCLDHVLSLVEPLLNNGSDPGELLRLAVKLVRQFPEEFDKELTVVHCADLMTIYLTTIYPNVL